MVTSLVGQWYRSGNTHRGNDGKVVTFANPHWPWARITPGGRIHRVDFVLVRWNHNGGTREKPALAYTFKCGQKQQTQVYRAEEPTSKTWCRRCKTIDVMKAYEENE